LIGSGGGCGGDTRSGGGDRGSWESAFRGALQKQSRGERGKMGASAGIFPTRFGIYVIQKAPPRAVPTFNIRGSVGEVWSGNRHRRALSQWSNPERSELCGCQVGAPVLWIVVPRRRNLAGPQRRVSSPGKTQRARARGEGRSAMRCPPARKGQPKSPVGRHENCRGEGARLGTAGQLSRLG